METIEIKKTNIQEAFKAAKGNIELQKCLRLLFGDEIVEPAQELKDVKDRIKTFEDALNELGEEAKSVKEFRYIIDLCADTSERPTKDLEAYLKLRIVCEALNEGWKPKFEAGEDRYYPWHYLYDQDEVEEMEAQEKEDRHLIETPDEIIDWVGFAYANSSDAPSGTSVSVGSRLCLKNEALAVYCGKQFINLWADFKL